MDNKTVQLRNGTSEAKPLVWAVYYTLEALFARDPVVFHELVKLARNPRHKLWGDTAELLKNLSFIKEDGIMHDSVRNIVLAASEGDGLQMRLVFPVPDENALKEYEAWRREFGRIKGKLQKSGRAVR